jgi:hypothetical protein
MARIGTTHPQSRIYNLALGRYEEQYEMEQIGNRAPPASGLTSRQRVSEAALGNQKIIFGAYDAPRFNLEDTTKYYKAKAKSDNIPTTEYQKKIGSRSQGSFMQMADNKPYLELAGKALNGDLYSVAPSTDLLSEQEMYKLMTVYKPSMIQPQTEESKIIEEVAKVGSPYKQDLLSRENENPREFIEKDLYKVELYPSEYISKGDGGSNLVFDYKKEMNKGTQPKTREQLYNEYFNSRKSTSNVNVMQRDAAKAREVLSVYGNKQHEQAPANKADIRPEIVKAKAAEQKAHDKIENREEKGKVAMDASNLIKQAATNVLTGGDVDASEIVKQGLKMVSPEGGAVSTLANILL